MERKPKPNIIVITVDDLGWSGLNCTGSSYYETGYIDQLAEEGVKFTSAYAAAAVCSPSWSAFIGKYPARTDILNWVRAELDDSELFERMRQSTSVILENF